MPRKSAKAIEAIAALLSCYTDEIREMTFSEVVATLGIAKSTAHRLLTALSDGGVLRYDEASRSYRLGPLMLQVGLTALRQLDVRRQAYPHMMALRDSSGETVVLSLPSSEGVIPVEQIPSLHEMRMTQELGRRYPLHAGATGRLVLSYLPEPERKKVLSSRLSAFTASTITDPELLRRHLAHVRKLGLAMSRGERVAGVVAVAAPVWGHAGELEAALTVVGPDSRFDPESLTRAAQLVKRSANLISLEMGCPKVLLAGQFVEDYAPGGSLHELLVETAQATIQGQEERVFAADGPVALRKN